MKIALIGAGGKIGVRLANNLKGSPVKEAADVDCVPVEAALDAAKAVVLAVPDTAISKVAAGIVPKIAAGRWW